MASRKHIEKTQLALIKIEVALANIASDSSLFIGSGNAELLKAKQLVRFTIERMDALVHD